MRLVLVLFLAAAAPAMAQPVASPAPACTYDACALRVEPGLFSRDLLQGVDGTRVGRFGVIDSDLEEAVLGSEYAVEQARQYDRTHRLALLTAVGAVALFVLSVPDGVRGRTDGVSTASGIGALVLSITSIRFQAQSERALSRSIWEYNRTLADDGASNPPGTP